MRVVHAALVCAIVGWAAAGSAVARAPQPDPAATFVTAESLLQHRLQGDWYWDTTLDGQGFVGVVELRPDGSAHGRSGGVVSADPLDPQSPPMSISSVPQTGSWQVRFAADGAAELVLAWQDGPSDIYRLFSDGTLRTDWRHLFRR